MITFPKAVASPKLVRPYGRALGMLAGAIFAVMALVHLFRVDTFVPLLDHVLPGGQGWAGFIGALIVIFEVFAIPFCLRMKLSPLGHLCSGILVVLAPLAWLLITIWGYGNTNSTAEFGQFLSTPSSWTWLIINVLWLAYCYFTLWALGFNRIKLRQIVSK